MPNITNSWNWAVATCGAADVGYSQSYRNQQTVNGITYYDCSSFIWYALVAGGFDVQAAYRTAMGYAYSGNAITTSYERAWLLALGFTPIVKTGTWLPGDICWRSGHTEMVYEGGNGQGRTMGAHTSNKPLADQVSIYSSPTSNTKWSEVFRYGGGGSGGADIPPDYPYDDPSSGGSGSSGDGNSHNRRMPLYMMLKNI